MHVKLPKGKTPKERMLLVADLIEADYTIWEQTTWHGLKEDREWDVIPCDELRSRVTCNTTCCIAGWAVAVTPKKQLAEMMGGADSADYETAGRQTLSLTENAASFLFDSGWERRLGSSKKKQAKAVVSLLRTLAEQFDGEHTVLDIEDLAEAGHPVARDWLRN